MDALRRPCVLFALRREAAPFLNLFREKTRLNDAPLPVWQCDGDIRVMMLECGVGTTRAVLASKWMLDTAWIANLPVLPSLIVSAGFAGALSPELRIGDVIHASEVTFGDGRMWQCEPPHPKNGSYRVGRLLTWNRIVSSVAEKASLHQTHHAVAVDMESAAIAEVCAMRGIRFAAVRAISDDAHSDLHPDLAKLVANGQVSVAEAIRTIGKSPSVVKEMWRLARATRLAGNNLAAALRQLLLEHQEDVE